MIFYKCFIVYKFHVIITLFIKFITSSYKNKSGQVCPIAK